jgi:hypothetical protein
VAGQRADLRPVALIVGVQRRDRRLRTPRPRKASARSSSRRPAAIFHGPPSWSAISSFLAASGKAFQLGSACAGYPAEGVGCATRSTAPDPLGVDVLR